MENLSGNPGELLESRITDREIGAKILTQNNFRARHPEIVDSSFEKARREGEKLIGKNDERRVDAYLGRLDRGVEKYGTKYEKRLWDKTVDSLIVSPEDIPDKYWDTQEQILRDNGQSREISDSEKDFRIKDIQEKQRRSLEPWTSYLSHEDCPYPTWFKVYTIDGISKMGAFDKSKNKYSTRDKGSVAPYPHLNPATLAKVYDVITSFYGINPDKDLNANNNCPELDSMVKTGSFNKLYSRLLLSEKIIMKTPETTEECKGEWVEYGLGDEEKIAAAADGTPWCVATPSVGRNYLATGRYDRTYQNDEHQKTDAKFFFYHLYDVDGRLADNACASIRLGTDGNVAEISGLKIGQALEDPLVPIVEEKVKSLPGGEKFLKRFADKKQLIAIDRKMQKSEDVTEEELRFIWEMDRHIETLDTYLNRDPRIKEFREEYGSEYAAERGYIIPVTTLEQVEENLEKYLAKDPELKSNLLTYVLKKSGKTDGLSPANLERIKNLETYESDNYIFMLPKDKWENGKIELPNDPEHRSLAPSDLTAILKAPVDYNELSESYTVYDKKWVGREIRHFPWGKELFEAEKEFLKPNGYHIPEDWTPIVDGLEKEIGVHGQKELSTALEEKFKLIPSGYVFEGELKGAGWSGYFWSTNENSIMIKKFAHCLDLFLVNPNGVNCRPFASSVRCVHDGNI